MTAVPVPEPPLEDDAVRVRAWRADDLRARVDAWRDPELMRFMLQAAPPEPSLAAAREWLALRERRRERGDALFLVIADRSSDRALGSVWLWQLNRNELRAEIGYWLLREARGRGAATRAVRLVSRYAFGRLGLERLDLFTLPDNDGSRRVAERAGFNEEGLLRAYRRRGDERVDMVVYGLVRDGLAR